MIAPDLFDAFAGHYDPPYRVIEDLLRGGSDSVRDALISAIAAVPGETISALGHDTSARLGTIFTTKDADLQARLHIVSDEAASAIQRRRLSEVGSPTTRPPLPYGHSALAETTVDEEGLVALADFHIDGDGLRLNDYTFFLLPPVPGSNSAYWLLQEFRRHGLIESVRVRLDPFLFGPAEVLSGRFYKATVWAKPLDWDRVSQLRVTEHGRWTPGAMSRQFLATDYAWRPHGNEVDFICEELPVRAELAKRGSRYLHAVYNKNTDRITHLDGAMRIYEPHELEVRANQHVRNAGKVGKRVKIFRTDRPIDPNVFTGIVEAFFCWNYDVARYFGADIPNDF